MPDIKELIVAKDHEGLQQALQQHPSLANEGIPLDKNNPATAHPLHRICDGVYHQLYTDAEAVEIAKIFLACGAQADGCDVREGQDTPLVAAASLHAEQTGILYISHGANIHHAGCHGGTALHWAAWTGRDQLVKRLIHEQAAIDNRCTAFRGTPLLWAVHGYKFGGGKNRHHQLECVRLLLAAGADKTIPNGDGTMAMEFLDEEDREMRALLG